MFKRMMKSKGVAPLEEMQQAATALGVRILPCQMSMDVMGICSGDCIPEAEAPVGVATFIVHAAESKITLFI